MCLDVIQFKRGREVRAGQTQVDPERTLRQLRGGALSDLLCSLLKAFFGETGETSVALWWNVRVKDARW